MKGRTPRILVIEDSRGDVLLFEQALKSNKWHVELSVARDGVEAMACLLRTGKYAEAPTPDLILLDINLPKKDGLEVLAEVKGDLKLRRLPVVVMTTSSGPRDIGRACDLHANLCVTKPLEFQQFCRVIRFIEEWLELADLPCD
jgi:two-component system, chemotaxis family, response regulator Rcp1